MIAKVSSGERALCGQNLACCVKVVIIHDKKKLLKATKEKRQGTQKVRLTMTYFQQQLRPKDNVVTSLTCKSQIAVSLELKFS